MRVSEMIMRYTPPFIFAHRCYLERRENELAKRLIVEKFGEGGMIPQPEHRWLRGQTQVLELKKMGIDGKASGIYYGFRTRDDQMLFYMLFEGILKK